jgi:cell division topological specificity factor
MPAEPASKHVAKERLKLALTYDRGDLTRGTIEQLRHEIIRLIAKHLTIKEEEIQISFDRSTEYDKLIATIPLRTAPRPRPQVTKVADTKKVHSRHRRR